MNQVVDRTTEAPAKPLAIAFVQASWHSDIVEQSHTGFISRWTELKPDAEPVDMFRVPGAYDIPLLAKRLCESGRYDAVVAAGLVVDGGIYRHDFVAATVVDALMHIQLETAVPVLSVVLTPHQFQETQAHRSFFSAHFVTKGAEAANACAMICENLQALG